MGRYDVSDRQGASARTGDPSRPIREPSDWHGMSPAERLIDAQTRHARYQEEERTERGKRAVKTPTPVRRAPGASMPIPEGPVREKPTASEVQAIEIGVPDVEPIASDEDVYSEARKAATKRLKERGGR
jgi:hypothetical protein